MVTVRRSFSLSMSSFTPLTVTVCAVPQLPEAPAVKVRVCVAPAVPPALLTVAALAVSDVTVTVTSWVGSVFSTTV